MLPSLFLSHGAPTLPLDDCLAREFLRALGATLPRPRAILVVSAHWDSQAPTVNRVTVNDTIHDFYGFPEALYEMHYRAHSPNAPSNCWRRRVLGQGPTRPGASIMAPGCR